ncbi:hypothetical protein [Pedobacter helvus]|uniref:Uncharacterized protein n=1 Tax=Pedobacter helvus TaxID=2563444 RepID=A0ABW9JK08_9SPHI|nr:hypothetical protein [Pedobacter ureilyticus]
MKTSRLCIYAKDISIITGKGIRSSQKLLKEIKTKLNKQSHQYVSLKEFAEYTGIEFELVTKSCW